MKKYIKNIISECLEDEVNIDHEWTCLYSSIMTWKKKDLLLIRNRRLFIQYLKYAVAVVLGVFLSISTYYIITSREQTVMGNYRLTTGKGEKSSLQLPDGTKIWLNSSTTIEYTVNYGCLNRDVYLEGEAYFEVAKNQKYPFVVKSNDIEIKALGTSFNISAYIEDYQLITTLFSGEVSVKPILLEQEILLKPNQVAIYYKNNNKIEVKPYDKKCFAQWKNDIWSFEMEYLQDITNLLERNYGVVFRYENQEVKKLKFSGAFYSKENLFEILDIIKTNTGIQYQMIKDTIVIK